MTLPESADPISTPVRRLLEVLDRLGDIAQSHLPQSAKLELLSVQIGTARLWAEQVSGGTEAAAPMPGPHWHNAPASHGTRSAPASAVQS